MKAFTVLILSVFFFCVGKGLTPPSALRHVDELSVAFFKTNGFGFSVDNSMSHHYDKATIEISILIPDQFTNGGSTNHFKALTILSEDLSADLATHPHSGKKRSIVTISEETARKSRVLFYFGDQPGGAPQGSVYHLDLAKVIEEWKSLQAKKPGKRDL